MHQRRVVRVSLPQFMLPITTALIGSWGLIVFNANPLCVLWTPDNPEYWLFFCYLTG
jgi:hypothetical protein